MSHVTRSAEVIKWLTFLEYVTRLAQHLPLFTTYQALKAHKTSGNYGTSNEKVEEKGVTKN